ncbi:uncharacterized protein LOC142338566 [Convolutriloba macropyga]|uniref:uncharacterized protein LOC142338566 n=1 Tax=Convolutriloba macropyga TaxID=536237 RepID=UPI003F5279D6
MRKSLFLAGLIVTVVQCVPFSPSPIPHLYSKADQVCKDIYEGIYSGYGPFTTANQTIPTQWEPSGNKQGYTEHNNFAQLILCTLNKKRQDVIIPPLQWHYGLSYLAENHNTCDESYDVGSMYGFSSIKKLNYKVHFSSTNAAYAEVAVQMWYARLQYYKYPIKSGSTLPDKFDKCPNREYMNGYTQDTDPFTIMMWLWGFYVGCAPVSCSDGTRINCMFTDNMGYPIHSSNPPAYSGYAFFKSSRDLIHASPESQMFGGLPTCYT